MVIVPVLIWMQRAINATAGRSRSRVYASLRRKLGGSRPCSKLELLLYLKFSHPACTMDMGHHQSAAVVVLRRNELQGDLRLEWLDETDA